MQKILITQPKPDKMKSRQYFELFKEIQCGNLISHHVSFAVGSHSGQRFFANKKLKSKIHTAVVFTSRNAIDHFFRTMRELKINVSQDTNIFCITEAVALYPAKIISLQETQSFLWC
jgi:uroporphyrinogen-III synthase